MAGVQKAQRVVLIGFMGAGKTSVGKKLAQELGWRFVDLDDVIESRSQNSVAEIFATAGEKRFRELETEALDFLLGQSNEDMVLALGGGAFVQPANRALLDRAAAATVLLQAPVEELHRRCRLDGRVRPLAQKPATFLQLFEERRAAYESAELKMETMGKDVEQVAAEV